MLMMLFWIASACGHGKSTLTRDEKSWNPYSTNQRLVFHSENGSVDTLEISQVIDGGFPEGIGARANERLRVTAKHRKTESKGLHELSFLYIIARWQAEPSKIDFEFFLPDKTFWGRSYPIQDLEGYTEISIETPYGNIDDVIVIEDNSRRPYNKDNIKTIFWSKSKGYVRFEQYDGSVGELANIIQ
jgi:hypothetical protein